MRIVSDFRDNTKMQVKINDLIGSGSPPPAPLASTYHIKETWDNALYRNPGQCWLWDDEKELSIFHLSTRAVNAQCNMHYFNERFFCWEGRVAKACMCHHCHTIVSDRQQLRQMQPAPVETEALLKLEGGILLISKHPAGGFLTPGTPHFQPF